MNHIKDILAGLAIFLVAITFVGGIVGGIIFHDYNQRQVRAHMNEVCIAKGYEAWNDDTYDGKVMGCVNKD